MYLRSALACVGDSSELAAFLRKGHRYDLHLHKEHSGSPFFFSLCDESGWLHQSLLMI